MSKRSTNLENLLKQKENIEEKIFKLQIQLKGIQKSIEKIESSTTVLEETSNQIEG